MTQWNEQNAYAEFSECGRYRYDLCRMLGDSSKIERRIAFIGLNPSTADATTDDPTVRRCWRFAKQWGFHTFHMLNLFGFRATDPADMKSEPEPIGAGNDEAIESICSISGVIVCAWGVHGQHMGRDLQVIRALRPYAKRVRCLGTTKDGFPRHPLYLRNDAALVAFDLGGKKR